MIVYEQVYEVRGTGSFPIDMLRYDSSWPATGDDASLVANGREHEHVEHVVTLMHRGEKGWQPTAGRWASYGFPVGAFTTERRIG